MLSGCSSSQLLSIDRVAKSNMSVLQQNEQWRLFDIHLAPTEILGDHQSGSRIIISLSEMKIQRLAGDLTPIEVDAYKAFYLTNRLSKGIKNIGQQSIKYLVLEAKDPFKKLIKSDRKCKIGTTLLAFDSLMVCKVMVTNTVQAFQNESLSWLYSEQEFSAQHTGISTNEFIASSSLVLTSGEYLLNSTVSPIVIIEFE